MTASVDARVRELLDAGAHADAATEAIRALGPAALRYLRSLLRDAAPLLGWVVLVAAVAAAAVAVALIVAKFQ